MEQFRRTLIRRLNLIGLASNGFGGFVVAAFLVFFGPNTLSTGEFERLLDRALPVFIVYMAVTLPRGRYLVGVRPWRPIDRWLEEDRPATEDERRLVLRYPIQWALWSAPFWFVGAALLGAIVFDFGASVGVGVTVTIALGGLTACALQYLLVERAIREVTARALAGGPPPRASTPGVRARLTIAWTLATAVPVLGAGAMALVYLIGGDLDRDRTVLGILFLCLLALTTGFAAMWFASRSVAEPLESMRGTLARVESVTSVGGSTSRTAARWDCFRPASTAWSAASPSASACVTRSALSSIPS